MADGRGKRGIEGIRPLHDELWLGEFLRIHHQRVVIAFVRRIIIRHKAQQFQLVGGSQDVASVDSSTIQWRRPVPMYRASTGFPMIEQALLVHIQPE